MKKLNDAFDEFMIDPVQLVAHYSLSVEAKRYVTNALSPPTQGFIAATDQWQPNSILIIL